MRSIAFAGCAGWIYEGHSRRGVVLCPPLGLEELCGRRTLHLLAQSLSAAGLPTLRFDYRGEGDSLGDANDPGCAARWREDVSAAIETLKQATGVSEIALVGMRFGSLIAAEIAAGRHDIARFAMIAPVAAGKSYLRETRILSRMIQTEGPQDDHAPDDLGLAGFTLSDETCEAIAAMSIERLEGRPAPAVLLVEQAASRGGAKISAHFEKLGALVERREFPNYETMMCDPALSLPAEDILPGLTQWLAAEAVATPRAVRAIVANVLGSDGWSEEGVLFGALPLAGVYCRPAADTPRRIVVFAGPGNNHHLGWGRSHVELARALAKAGVASLRFDYAGVGDSGGTQTDIYAAERTADIEAALDWAHARDSAPLAIVAVCSGAYHALRIGAKDARIDRLVLLNQQRYELDLHHRLSWLAYTLQARLVFAIESEDRPSFKTKILAATLAVLPKVRRIGSLANRALRKLKGGGATADAGPNQPERQFRAISARGAQALIVHSPTDPAVAEIERFLGPDGQRAIALAGVRKIVLHEADHLLSSRSARRIYESELIAFLG